MSRKQPMGGVRPEAIGAWYALDGALLRLTESGRSTPCQHDPEPWHADDKPTRDEAATACTFCPVRRQCSMYADAQREDFGVWGGTDRTPRPRRNPKTKESQ